MYGNNDFMSFFNGIVNKEPKTDYKEISINDRINMLCNEINLIANDYEADYGIRIISAERSETGKLKFKIKKV